MPSHSGGETGDAADFSTAKATIVNGDKFAMLDSEAADAPKHSLWSLIKSTLKSYFDTLYLALAAGTVAQTKYGTLTGKVSTNSVMNSVDTPPTSSQGMEMIAVAITPRSASSIIKITISGWWQLSAANTPGHGLFKDSDVNAFWSGLSQIVAAANHFGSACFVVYVAAGSTDARTYKWRAGPTSAATVYAYGSGAADDLGGTMQHSMTVEEILQ